MCFMVSGNGNGSNSRVGQTLTLRRRMPPSGAECTATKALHSRAKRLESETSKFTAMRSFWQWARMQSKPTLLLMMYSGVSGRSHSQAQQRHVGQLTQLPKLPTLNAAAPGPLWCCWSESSRLWTCQGSQRIGCSPHPQLAPSLARRLGRITGEPFKPRIYCVSSIITYTRA